MNMLTRTEKGGDLPTMFSRMDRLFEEWMRSLPMRRVFGQGGDWPGDELIHVDEFRDAGTQVIRAELAGIDPEKDVEITVQDGMLQIAAQRRVEETDRGQGLHAPRAAVRQLQARTAVAGRRLGVRHHRHLQGRHPRDPRSGDRAVRCRHPHQDRHHEGLTGRGRVGHVGRPDPTACHALGCVGRGARPWWCDLTCTACTGAATSPMPAASVNAPPTTRAAPVQPLACSSEALARMIAPSGMRIRPSTTVTRRAGDGPIAGTRPGCAPTRDVGSALRLCDMFAAIFSTGPSDTVPRPAGIRRATRIVGTGPLGSVDRP